MTWLTRWLIGALEPTQGQAVEAALAGWAGPATPASDAAPSSTAAVVMVANEGSRKRRIGASWDRPASGGAWVGAGVVAQGQDKFGLIGRLDARPETIC